MVYGRATPVLCGPNSTESNLFHHKETTYRVGRLSENATIMLLKMMSACQEVPSSTLLSKTLCERLIRRRRLCPAPGYLGLHVLRLSVGPGGVARACAPKISALARRQSSCPRHTLARASKISPLGPPFSRRPEVKRPLTF